MTQAQVDERLKDFERLAAGEIFGQKKLIRNLSAGNKQKVGIISALFNRPKLVILDEPFNFLDPRARTYLSTCSPIIIRRQVPPFWFQATTSPTLSTSLIALRCLRKVT